jgi:hypothetical protein
MALLFVDGFDHYTTQAVLFQKWNGASDSTWTLPSTGRRGTGGATTTSQAAHLIRILPAAVATLIAGVAFTMPGTPTSAQPIIVFCDTGIGNTTCQITICVNANLAIEARRGNQASGTLLGTSPNNAVVSGSYQYIEAKVFVAATVGTVRVKVNGVTVLDLINQNTKNTANTTMSQICAATPFSNTILDDFYCCDTTGPDNADFLGDCRVDTLMPNGDGTHLQWTPTGGGAHYTQVNAIPPQIVNNVSDGTLGEKDTYDFANLAAITGLIFGVQEVLYAQKSDAGARSVQHLCRSAGVDSAGSAIALGTGANIYPRIFERDPATTAPWIEAGINGAQFGAQVA